MSNDDLQLPPYEPDAPDDVAADPPAKAADPPPAPADDLYEVKVGGKAFRVPKDELISGYQRQQDYTRKTMELAERQREFDRIRQEHSTWAQEREQLKAFLQNRDALQEYLKHLQGFESPDQPVSAAQMQAIIERQAAARQQEMEAGFQRMAFDLEVKHTAAEYSAKIDATIADAMSQFPELRSVRRIEKILKEEVAERQPSTLAEAQQLFYVVAKEQAEGLRSFVAEEKKQAAAKAAKLQNGIEPPGGTGVQPTNKALKLGSQALRDAFEASLRGDGSQ